MSDAPERIKAWCWNNKNYAGQWHVDGRGETTEYIRADVSAARIAEAQALIYAARQERNAAEDAEKELAEELRTVKAQLAEAREVKPLEWEDFGELGAKASAFYQANYLIQKWSGEGRFEVSMSYPGYQTGYDGPRWHPTLEAAKAAAQADFTARILSALKGTP